MAKTKRIGIANEVDEIAQALDGARLLTDQLLHDQFGTKDDAKRAPRIIAAIINLATARAGLLAQVLRGSHDPRLIWAPYNDATPVDARRGELVLEEWGRTTRGTKAKGELRRGKRSQSGSRS